MMPQMKEEIDTYLSHPYIQVHILSRHIYMYIADLCIYCMRISRYDSYMRYGLYILLTKAHDDVTLGL